MSIIIEEFNKLTLLPLNKINDNIINYNKELEKEFEHLENIKRLLIKKNDEIIKLKEELKKEKRDNQILNFILESRSDIDKNKCSICLENDISKACFPCGHTYCNSCINYDYYNCHICRTPIKNIERIYL
jgi:hypothetical protein